jgi:uncharacterized RDD family membrane protein YckC
MEDELLDDFQASIASGKMVHASFRKRLLATGVDVFIFMGIFIIFSSLIINAIGSYFIYQYIELFYPIAIVFYIAFAESSPKQGTFGKQFLKIKVINKQGGRISFMHALGRMYVKVVLIPLLLVALLFGNKNRQDGDILDTYVIENKPKLDE